MDPIQHMIVDALEKLGAAGWEAPIFFVAVAANGSMVYGRYDATDAGGLEATLLAEHIEDAALMLPINMMMSNTEGEAIRLSINKPDDPIVYH
jgi:hypothetical protein